MKIKSFTLFTLLLLLISGNIWSKTEGGVDNKNNVENPDKDLGVKEITIRIFDSTLSVGDKDLMVNEIKQQMILCEPSFLRNSTFNDKDLKEDLESIKLFLRSKGYYKAKVKIIDVRKIYPAQDEKNYGAFIKIEVSLGNIYYFGSVKFDGNRDLKDEDIQSLIIDTEQFKPYDFSKLLSDQTNMLYKYQTMGYGLVKVEIIEKEIAGNLVEVVFKIKEGGIIRINKVKIEGAEQVVHDWVILQTINLEENEIYNIQKLDLIKETLFKRFPFLKSIFIELRELNLKGKVDIIFQFETQRSGLILIGAGLSTNDGINGIIRIESNLTKLADKFKIKGQWGYIKSEVGLSYETPLNLNIKNNILSLKFEAKYNVNYHQLLFDTVELISIPPIFGDYNLDGVKDLNDRIKSVEQEIPISIIANYQILDFINIFANYTFTARWLPITEMKLNSGGIELSYSPFLNFKDTSPIYQDYFKSVNNNGIRFKSELTFGVGLYLKDDWRVDHKRIDFQASLHIGFAGFFLGGHSKYISLDNQYDFMLKIHNRLCYVSNLKIAVLYFPTFDGVLDVFSTNYLRPEANELLGWNSALFPLIQGLSKWSWHNEGQFFIFPKFLGIFAFFDLGNFSNTPATIPLNFWNNSQNRVYERSLEIGNGLKMSIGTGILVPIPVLPLRMFVYKLYQVDHLGAVRAYSEDILNFYFSVGEVF